MLVKQGIDISFAQGLDTKTDPKRVQIGKFLKLQNSVFNKGGLLQKRNGYGLLTSLPSDDYSYLTTFNGNLTALASNIAAYNQSDNTWVQKGQIQPITLSTLPLVRNSVNQISCDSAISPNGLICTVYQESNGSSTINKFVVANATTGQNVIPPSQIVAKVTPHTVSGGMRVFVLGIYFVIVFTDSTSGQLQFTTINYNNLVLLGFSVEIDSYTASPTLSWDGVVAGGNLYLSYYYGSSEIKVVYITPSLTTSATRTFASYVATSMSVTADTTSLVSPGTPIIWITFYDKASQLGYSMALNSDLSTRLAPTAIIPSPPTATHPINIASAAQKDVLTVFYETPNGLPIDTSFSANFVSTFTVTVSGTVSTVKVSIRSLGLGSKAFIVNGVVYYLGAYQNPFQSTYFLINGSLSTSAAPVVVAKVAYENGGWPSATSPTGVYLPTGLPSVSVNGTTVSLSYLIKDFLQAINTATQQATPPTNIASGLYTQSGINEISFVFGTQGLDVAEIGNDLHITGGFLWMYDGFLPVEHNFLLYPDTVSSAGKSPDINLAVWSTTGGAMVSRPTGWVSGQPTYFYQFTYEWSDNQGNIFRSAPSLPIPVITTDSGSSITTGSVVLTVPTLRVTMKTVNPVKIVIYRWSADAQSYYQVTSISEPLLNDPTVDQVQFTDTQATSSIIGNALIYTTGGVVEDINAPSSSLLTLFDTRLWLVDAEDPNKLWFSKQVIEGTPVEMSDLLTMFIPPTTSTQGSTGPITAISVMDDKLIIFKKDAIYYVNGNGPDNTGANNQYSPPIFVTSSVGCANQNSIALMPQGLMFQSDKGIWLLGRGLDTQYIGAPVEDFTTNAVVNSVVGVPGTNQVRFTLSTGITLMYDYFYGQWGTFIGVPAISSCIFQTLHTFINSAGLVYQETAGTYVDGSEPVLMSFLTGPIRLGDLQNYQRAYFFYLLGTYFSPHQLQVSLFYDYEPNSSQSILINPNNYSTTFGSGPSQSPFGQQTPFGGGYSGEDGGGITVENWRVFLQRQRCMALNIQIQEVYDASLGVMPGAGFTLSGLNVVCAFKKAFRPQPAAITAG